MQYRACLRGLTILLALAFVVGDATVSAQQEAQARALLRTVLATYASASSMSARGHAVYTLEIEGEARQFITDYSVALLRPNTFVVDWRTAYKGDSSAGRVYSRQGSAWLYNISAGNCESFGDPQEALAAAAGISSGATFALPNLFFDRGSSLSTLVDVRLVGRESVGDTECHKLVGRRLDGASVSVWIRVAEPVILRIQRHVNSETEKGNRNDSVENGILHELCERGLQDNPENRSAVIALMTMSGSTADVIWSDVSLSDDAAAELSLQRFSFGCRQ